MATLEPTTILLVDDERDILAVLAAGIRRSVSDVRVLTAPDGWEGLKVLAEEKVDVIISDQKMPGMEGADFLAEARRRVPGATRIMLTAYPDLHLITRNVNDGHIRHFFTKPYRLAEIVELLRTVLRERGERAASRLALARAIEAQRSALPDVAARADPARGV